MSKLVVERLRVEFGARVLETSDFRGDEEVRVAVGDWLAVAEFLRRDGALEMDHFIDLTAVDYPDRTATERFDVLLSVRSLAKKHRIRVVTRAGDGQPVRTLTSVWAGANWAEREAWDMFGVVFDGHPDLRRILLYPEFEGHPLRKDYAIERTQPLVPYRETAGLAKLPPYGVDEGQPWGRYDWPARIASAHRQVSPALAMQQGERRTLSDSEANVAPSVGRSNAGQA